MCNYSGSRFSPAAGLKSGQFNQKTNSGLAESDMRGSRFRGSRFHSRPWTAFGMRIYEKSVGFVRPNPKFGAKLAIIWESKNPSPSKIPLHGGGPGFGYPQRGFALLEFH